MPTRVIGLVWSLASALLLLWSARGLYRLSQTAEQLVAGPRSATLLCMVFAIVGLSGGALAYFRVAAGRQVLVVLSILTLLYAASYFLMGGIDDTSGWYLLGVLTAAVLAVITLLPPRRLGAR